MKATSIQLYKYRAILETDGLKHYDIKEKLNARNVTLAINCVPSK